MTGAEEGAPLARTTAPSGRESMTDGELVGDGSISKAHGSETAPKAASSSTAVLGSKPSLLLPSPGAESRWMGISPSPFNKGHTAAGSSVMSAKPEQFLAKAGGLSRWMGISPSPFDRPHQAPTSSAAGAKAGSFQAKAGGVSRWMGISPSPFDKVHQASTSSAAGMHAPASGSVAAPGAMVTSPCKRLKALKEECPVKQESPKPLVFLVVEQEPEPVPELQLPPPPEQEQEPEPVPELQLPPPQEQEPESVPELQLPPPPKQEPEPVPELQLPPPPEPVPEPEPEAPAGWAPKIRRFWRDKMFGYLPPGVPTKVRYQSNLKMAAAEVQRRLGTNENLDQLGSGSQQLATVLPGNWGLASETLLMKAFCSFCRTHPMPHPPPPPPPAPPAV